MTPKELKAIEERAAVASEGPWFFNSYSGVFSQPKTREHIEWERQLDTRLAVEGREAVDDDFDAAPETLIASVPAHHGDTSSPQGAKDADFIAASRADIPALLAYVRELEGIVADMDSRVRELAGPEVMKLEDEWVAALAARDEAREIVRHARFEAPWKRKAFEAIVKWDTEAKR